MENYDFVPSDSEDSDVMEAENVIEEMEIIESVSSQVTRPVLPDKIWLKIFEFCSTFYRRNFRLVCKQWLEVCNDPRLLRKEAFFFNASYTFTDILKIIVNSGREHVNLKLQSYIIDAEANCLWETLGSKINSLKFSLCHFDGAILGHIIFSCPNMTELSVQGGSYNSGPLPSSDTFLLSKLRHPEERTIRREKLEKFEFEAHSMPVTSTDLNRIFSFFPNLKSLAITLCTEGRFKKKKDYLHFQNLLQLLTTKTSKIDTLFVNIEDGDSHLFNQPPIMQLKCLDDRDLSKLKDVGMRFAKCALNDDGLNTIVNYQFWTSLHITSHRLSQEKFNTFLIDLLEECPSLTIFRTYWKVSKAEQILAVFPAIVESRIKSLAFDIDNRTLHDQAALGDTTRPFLLKNLRKNHTVSHLALIFTSAFGFSSMFMEYFPKVRHLKLSHGALAEVFTALPNLLTLQVGRDIDYNDEFYSWSFKKSIKNVPGLLSLGISIFSFSRIERLSRIKFPDLQFLTLKLLSDELEIMSEFEELDRYRERDEDYEDYEFDDFEEDSESFPETIDWLISTVAQKTPNLQVLSFDFDSIDGYSLKCETGNCSRDVLAAFFKSCQKWRQLRYLEIKLSSYEIGDEFCKQHMTECYKKNPSLRAVQCVTEKERIASFFNSLENKVEFNEAVSRKMNSSNRLEIGIDSMNCWKLHD